MLPVNEEVEDTEEAFEEAEIETSNTIKVYFNENSMFGRTDGIEAIKQAIYIILKTERYKYPIHTWDFGIEIEDLFGKPMDYVESEIPDRITEALTADNRIENVTNFSFSRNREKLTVYFTAETVIGDIELEHEFDF